MPSISAMETELAALRAACKDPNSLHAGQRMAALEQPIAGQRRAGIPPACDPDATRHRAALEEIASLSKGEKHAFATGAPLPSIRLAQIRRIAEAALAAQAEQAA